MSRLRKFLSLAPADQILLMEAGFWLGLARLSLMLLPFRWIKLGWGKHNALTTETSVSTSPVLLERISWAVATASRHLPCDCLCLAQAMAGKALLKRRGVPSTLCLGLAKDNTNQLQGHAWLKCGDQVLIGQQGLATYTVLASFVEDEN